MVLAGLGWLAFLSPSLAKYLPLSIEILGILAEGLLMLWLLVKGVNVQRWKEQAGVRTAFWLSGQSCGYYNAAMCCLSLREGVSEGPRMR
jgi:hypothetical protein